jgi:hypothetical protein
MSYMKWPKYGEWCKQNVIETIRKQKINETEAYLEDVVFYPDSDLYSINEYDISDILWIINSEPDDLSKSLFSAVQHGFAEKYFQMAQEMNPQMDMKAIRNDGGEYLDLLYKTLENITIDEFKNAVMDAFEYGTEEVEKNKISYVKTITSNIAKAVHSGLVEIGNIYIDYLDPESKREYISTDKFIDNLIHLSQSGIFADTINWRYVDLFDSGKFLIEGDINHNNGYELSVTMATKNKEDKDRVVKILGESEE